ncbi:MAG: cellulose biosynthesis protein BcsS [Proteobacteria bacterium]|nr:cellulose biosynthesis protein BcsS [Pseudomonadota bacterium]
MCVRRRVRAAVPVAAAFLICVLCPAVRVAAQEEYSQVMEFSGRDLWRNGVFAYSGFLYAPGGFDRDGFMLKLLMNGGLYRYWPSSMPGQKVVGAEWQTQVLPGFRIKRGEAEMKLFFGPEWQTHWLRPDDIDNRLRGRNFGLRFAGELWWEPTPDTLIAGDLSLSTLVTSYSARIAYGWRVAGELLNDESFYVGPELQYFGADGYAQTRVGLHVTSLRTEDIEWSLAVGYARDTDGHSSTYVRLGLAQRL